MTSQSKGKTAANTLTFVGLIFLMVVLANVLSMHFYKRVDTTHEKRYTLSQASKNIIRSLPDRVNIKLFVSPDLKPPYAEPARFLNDLLSEYARESNGKIDFERVLVRPDDTDARKRAEDYKVQEGVFGSGSSQAEEVRKLYLGFGVKYQGTILSTPQVGRTEGLEFDVTGKIRQLAFPKRRVAFATSEQEAGPSINNQTGHSVSALVELLKQSGVDVATVDLKADIPTDKEKGFDVLLLIGPTTPFSERAQYVIDQFLMKGKAVGLFLDGQVETQAQNAMPQLPQGVNVRTFQPHPTGLEPLLTHYGITPQLDLVLDRQMAADIIPIPTQVGPIPALVKSPIFISASIAEKKHPAVSQLPNVILLHAGSFSLATTAAGNIKAAYDPLLQSSRCSWIGQGPLMLASRPTVPPCPSDQTRERVLAYAASGTFRSFFAGKQIVKEDGSKADPNQSQPDGSALITQSQGESRLVVVGDSDFITDFHLGTLQRHIGSQKEFEKYLVGFKFALNVVDWLSQDDAMTSIRNKSLEARPIRPLESSTIMLIKIVNTVGVPLLVCIIGLVVWLLRRSRRLHARLK